MKERKYDEAIDYLSEKVESPQAIRWAEFAAMSANTPHLMFDQIKSKINPSAYQYY